MASSWPPLLLRQAAAGTAPSASAGASTSSSPAARARQHDLHSEAGDHGPEGSAGNISGSRSRRRKNNNTRAPPPPAAAQRHHPHHHHRPTVDTFSARRDERITVATPPDGFLFDLRLSARVPHPPQRVFEVLADEEAHKIFRGIKETVSRDVLSDDGHGKRSLVVAHRAGLRFLGLTAAFETRLRVDEDRRAGTIHFRGADDADLSAAKAKAKAQKKKGGNGGSGSGSGGGGGGGGGGDAFMRRFEGSWQIQPFTEAALERAYGGGGGGRGSSGKSAGTEVADALGSLMARLGLGDGIGGGLGRGAAAHATETLVTLEQALAPRLTPPAPLQPLVRALCGRTLQHMVEDLKGELERRERARRRGEA